MCGADIRIRSVLDSADVDSVYRLMLLCLDLISMRLVSLQRKLGRPDLELLETEETRSPVAIKYKVAS